MNRKYQNQVQKIRAAYRHNKAKIAALLSSQGRLEQQMTRLTMAQTLAQHSVIHNSRPWTHIAGEIR